MSAITVNSLTFAHDGSYDNVFENVSFTIDTSWRLGLIGRNGRGKTTLLHLIEGTLDSHGAVKTPCGCDYFPFPVSEPHRTCEEIMLTWAPDAESWRCSMELAMLDMDDDVLTRYFDTLSNGEQTKVLLAALFLKEDRFLLIDEPTNHLDTQSRDIVCEYLRNKSGFILVSHDRGFIDGCVDHILSINKEDISVQKGNYSSWRENQDRADQFELFRNEKLKKDITRLGEAAGRTAGWSEKIEKQRYGSGMDRGYVGHKSAKMMARSKAIEKRQQNAIREKESMIRNVEENEPLVIHPIEHHAKYLMQLEDVSISYSGRTAVENISFQLMKGDRLCLRGKNGAGKSTIIKLIAGLEMELRGRFEKASNLKISYVPQDASFLKGDMRSFCQSEEIDETLFKSILRKFGFERVQFEKNMENLSAGQRKKVLLAASLCTQAHIYLWDEPLNYIDISSRDQIEQAILTSSPTMVFIEHERTFCENIATAYIDLK